MAAFETIPSLLKTGFDILTANPLLALFLAVSIAGMVFGLLTKAKRTAR